MGDLVALVAYTRTLPPAGGGAAEITLPLPVRALFGAGVIKDAAAKIDHSLPTQQPVAEAVTLEHGQYVANMCKGCHGPELAGGKVPGGPPYWPPAARLTRGDGNAMERYPSADAMIAMFRSGKRADGSMVQVMPFESLAKMNDTDLRALHLYRRAGKRAARCGPLAQAAAGCTRGASDGSHDTIAALISRHARHRPAAACRSPRPSPSARAATRRAS